MLRQITRHISRSGLNYSKRIALIPADGIGVEVVPAAVRVINHAIKESGAAPLEYVDLEAGWGTFEKTGHALPQKTIDALRECDGALFGAVSSPSHKVKGYNSPIVAMRNHLDLFANLRPIKSPSKEINGSRPGVDMFIVRENTECLYVKQERLEDDGEKAIANRVITKKASKRIARVAFELAETRRNKVTIVHKSNVLSVTDGMFRECCLEIASQFPKVQVEEQLVDSMVYKMFLNPQQYDVVVAPNLYGDILSDAGAALVGGLGLVPSANTGDKFIMVEPVHGSAPDIAGKNIANPIATIRAAAMLLSKLGGAYAKVALQIDNAVNKTLNDDDVKTPDLGGKATTTQVTDRVIAHYSK